jgi:hypothetical protein
VIRLLVTVEPGDEPAKDEAQVLGDRMKLRLLERPDAAVPTRVLSVSFGK